VRTRIFGKTNAPVSEVGLGCWQFGGDWGEVSDADAAETVATALDCGVTFIDTADVYGAGRSESIIGDVLKGHPGRGDVFIATKLGRLHGYPNQYTLDLFRRCCEESCKRLRRDTLDLTQLHCIPPQYLAVGEVFDWLRTLRDEGLIRAFGASVESIDEALACVEQDGLASLQIIFNIFRQKPIDTLFEKAKANNVAIIVRLPLASGLLAGKFTRDTAFPKQDHRNYNRDGDAFNVGETFAGLPFEKGVELAEQIKPWTPAGMTMAQMAIRWCLDFDAASVVIPGAKNPMQAQANAAASDMPRLSDELHARFRAFYANEVEEHIRGAH
jgi:aryl-alcohol dehydrogenase-like predicted oxidoreductase